MSDEPSEQEEPRVTDKRGQKKDEPKPEMPTAEELLADDNPSTFEQQAAEEAARQAEWDAMSEEEKQEVLARQAAEAEGVPFQGGGMQAPPNEHAGKKQVLTMFTIVVHNDGTALASDTFDLSMFEPQFPPDHSNMYRAICEIKKDLESTAAAIATVQLMNTQMQMMQQRAQAEALAGQLGRRGVRPPGR